MNLTDAWQLAGDPTQDRYMAWQVLAANRHQLDGSVYVRVPSIYMLESPAWRSIVEASVPICSCLLRRIILPVTPRAEFRPGETYVIDVSQNGGNADHLAFGPWGCDPDAAYSLMVAQTGLLSPTLSTMDWPYRTGATFGDLSLYPHEHNDDPEWQIPGPPQSFADIPAGYWFTFRVNATRLPAYRFATVDVTNGSIKLVLDQAMQTVSDNEQRNPCLCS